MTIDSVVIVSGGIDSTTVLYRQHSLGEKLLGLSFRYGQRHDFELKFATHHCEFLGVPQIIVELPWMKDLRSSALTNRNIAVPDIREVLGHPQPVTYVPFRNLLFLTIAAQFAEDRGAQRVVYGAQLHDLYGYWDTTVEFVDRARNLFQLNRLHRIEIEAPLAGNTKAENILLAVSLGVDLRMTFSCYMGFARHCGKCATCAERRKGFLDAGVKDPTDYADG